MGECTEVNPSSFTPDSTFRSSIFTYGYGDKGTLQKCKTSPIQVLRPKRTFQLNWLPFSKSFLRKDTTIQHPLWIRTVPLTVRDSNPPTLLR